jgi:hypothetical protein
MSPYLSFFAFEDLVPSGQFLEDCVRTISVRARHVSTFAPTLLVARIVCA